MRRLFLGKKELDRCRKKIEEEIRDIVSESKSRGVVLGLSGGVDSALVYNLACESGVDVLTLIMPEEGVTTKEDVEDAVKLVESVGGRYKIIKINPVIEALEKTFPFNEFSDRDKRFCLGNAKPRIRMTLNYLAANLDKRIVLGTGNRTEILLGYATKYGDAGVDIQPIGDLYKCQVRQLAEYMGVPKKIVWKTPTAGLWVGQTDEGEIGVKYEDLDAILNALVDCRLSVSQTAKKTGLNRETISEIRDRVERNKHKRMPPKIVKLF